MKQQLSLITLALAFSGAAWAQEVVKIGHVAPLSGAIAHLGKDNENGARLAIEDLNAKGISIGGKKVKFELLAEDDAADPKQGAAAAQKLADQKVSGVVGHLNSGTSIPASKFTAMPVFRKFLHRLPTQNTPDKAIKPLFVWWLTTFIWAAH